MFVNIIYQQFEKLSDDIIYQEIKMKEDFE